MTGQILDRDSKGILVLIIPVAFAIIVVCQFWPILLGLAVLIISWKVWENYQWRKWNEQVNPYFNNLIRENRGYLTALDLSLKANLTAKAAKAYLERKSAEYGTSPTEIEDRGLVYYFPTASALGRIFDDSEPLKGLEEEIESQRLVSQKSEKESSTATSLEQESEKATTTSTKTESASTKIEPINQAELAKRLDVNSSTVGRNKVKSEEDFAAWSKSRDPDDIAWKFIEPSNEFVPVDS